MVSRMGWIAIVCGAVAGALVVRELLQADPPDDDPVDVWSFRATERLKVHEARTQSDLESSGRSPLHLPNQAWWAWWAKQRMTRW